MELAKGKLTLTDNIYNQLLSQISNGVYPPESKLPSEQELCNIYSVSRISVRSALQRLEAIGIIETFHGKGSYVKASAPVEDSTPSDIADIQPYQMLSDKDFEEIWQFRYGIESQALTLFSVRAKEEDFKALDGFVDKMIDASNAKELAYASYEYYSYICNHCGNRYIANVANTYKSVLLAYIYTLQVTRKQNRSVVVQFHMTKNSCLRQKDTASILNFVTEENVLHLKKTGTV